MEHEIVRRVAIVAKNLGGLTVEQALEKAAPVIARIDALDEERAALVEEMKAYGVHHQWWKGKHDRRFRA